MLMLSWASWDALVLRGVCLLLIFLLKFDGVFKQALLNAGKFRVFQRRRNPRAYRI